MISSVLAALIGGMAQFAPSTPPTSAPTDADLIAALHERVPGAQVISVTHSALPADGSLPRERTSCGVARINGQMEPFSVRARWTMTGLIVVRVAGDDSPAPSPKAAWDLSANAPGWYPTDGSAENARRARNFDASVRRSALMACRDLSPPEGVTWVTEREPDPDPERRRRNEQRAKALTDAIFGSSS